MGDYFNFNFHNILILVISNNSGLYFPFLFPPQLAPGSLDPGPPPPPLFFFLREKITRSKASRRRRRSRSRRGAYPRREVVEEEDGGGRGGRAPPRRGHRLPQEAPHLPGARGAGQNR